MYAKKKTPKLNQRRNKYFSRRNHQIDAKTMAKNGKSAAEIGCRKPASAQAMSSAGVGGHTPSSWLANGALSAKIGAKKFHVVAQGARKLVR